MKKDLLILHGALGSIAQFEGLITALSDHFEVHGFNFSGHGGVPRQKEFGIRQFADELQLYVTAKGLMEYSIFGYSMGGYVALYAASNGLCPENIVTLGTKLNWSREAAEKEITQLNPEIIAQKVPAFAAQQAALHAPLDWKIVMQHTAEMMRDLGNSPLLTETEFSRINCPVHCLRGEEDRMVSEAETRWAVEHLPNATYQELPNTPHPIERIDPKALSHSIFACLT